MVNTHLRMFYHRLMDIQRVFIKGNHIIIYMTRSNNIEDYPYLTDTSLWHISETNTKYVQNFISLQRVKGIHLSSVLNYARIIILFIRYVGREDVLTLTQDDILRVFLQVDSGGSGATSNQFYIISRLFLKKYKTKEELDNLYPFTKKNPINKHETSDYITLEDVRRMRDYAESQGDVRSMALIMMLFGTGARISELLDARICDVEIKQYSGILSVNGKTGKRKIPFVIGLTEIITWINAHPLKDNKESPLFVTYNTKGNKVQKISTKTVTNYFRNVKKVLGIPADVKCNPHAFRHLLATTMAKKLTLREMNRLFGWSDGSNTAITYLHTSDKDLEASILEFNGVITNEEVEEKPDMFIQCPSCNAILPPGAVQCPKCRMILDPVLAVQLNNITEDAKKRDLLKDYIDK